MQNLPFLVAIEIRRLNLYYDVLEGAKLLGGKRLDQQKLDDLGWWIRTIFLEFEVQADNFCHFESELKKVHKDKINIIISRAALPS